MLYGLIFSLFSLRCQAFFELFLLKMKLSEIVEELTRKNPDGTRLFTQDSLGKRLGTNQSTVSQMLAARTWDDHWEIILKLIPICIEHDFIGARDLLSPAAYELYRAVEDRAGSKNRMSRLAGALEYPGIPGGAGWIEKDR